MAGVGSLKKPGSGKGKAETAAADDFINAAKVDGQRLVETLTKKENKGSLKPKPKKVLFSLPEDTDLEVERLSLTSCGVRISRSDVIKAAVALLASQEPDEIARLLRETK